MRKGRVFNRKPSRYDESVVTVGTFLLKVLKCLGISLLSFWVLYFVFSLFFDTDRERALSEENKAMEQEYARLKESMELVSNVIDNLEARDRTIYNDVFNTDPPKFSLADLDTTQLSLTELYDMPEEDLIWDTYALVHRLEVDAYQVNNRVRSISEHFSGEGVNPVEIPSIIPIENFSVLQTGASLGQKFNPFYKTIREHTGIDLMAPVGTEVRCSANGIVESVEKSARGFGNRIKIRHTGNIITTYAHLSVILVKPGQPVKRGTMIGRVGSSGNTFAPCLHYEIIRNGEYQNPVNYFYGELNPDKYREMMMIAQTTGQSMD